MRPLQDLNFAELKEYLQIEFVPFNQRHSRLVYDVGWKVFDGKFAFKEGKLYPTLALLYMDRLKHTKIENLKPRFLNRALEIFKNFSLGNSTNTVILHAQIVGMPIPSKCKNLDDFTKTVKPFPFFQDDFRFRPQPSLKNYPQYDYEFISPHFWVDNGIYERFLDKRLDPYYHNIYFYDGWYPSMESIWNFFCLADGRVTVNRWDFLQILANVKYLGMDLLMDGGIYKWSEERRKRVFSEYIGLARSKDITVSEGIIKSNWLCGKRTSTDLFKLRLRDALTLINQRKGLIKSVAESFLDNMVQSLASHLLESQIISRCPTCHQFFEPEHKRIYCSSSCRRAYNNRKNYIKNRENILPRARIYQREYRKL